MPPIVYGLFFVLAVILRIVLKSSSKIVELSKEAFSDVFSGIECEKCKKINNQNDKFCIHCGNTLQNKTNQNTKYCTKCGTENEKGNKFCIQCANNEFTTINLLTLENSLVGYVATLSAYIAKSDKVITQAEADLINNVLQKLSNNNSDIKKGLKLIFNKAKDTSIKNHTLIANKLYTAIVNSDMDYNERQLFMNILCFYFIELVYIDGDFNTIQDKTVVDILICLKIPENEINAIRNELLKEKKQSNNKNSSSSNTNPSISEAYNMLNCKASDSDEIVKKSYKELAKQYHPDVISGKGLADDFIEFANQRFKDINNAYDVIKKVRGI